jgi:hypothetical protein
MMYTSFKTLCCDRNEAVEQPAVEFDLHVDFLETQTGLGRLPTPVEGHHIMDWEGAKLKMWFEDGWTIKRTGITLSQADRGLGRPPMGWDDSQVPQTAAYDLGNCKLLSCLPCATISP